MSDRIRGLFDRIAPRYDFVNGMIGMGQMPRWRRLAVRRSGVQPGDRVLDCAAGTGALSVELARAVGPGGHVTALDISPTMLGLLPRAAQRARLDNITPVLGDMLALPFADGSFDCATVAFGVRNTDDPQRALAEMARVVRPGGTVAVLETGMPDWQPWRWLYDKAYTGFIFTTIGGLATGEWQAYRHLRDSVRAFPYGAQFVARLRGAGRFDRIDAYPLLGGAVWLYVARTART